VLWNEFKWVSMKHSDGLLCTWGPREGGKDLTRRDTIDFPRKPQLHWYLKGVLSFEITLLLNEIRLICSMIGLES
jgi:hypothetical protein